jgi:hypothetical protein
MFKSLKSKMLGLFTLGAAAATSASAAVDLTAVQTQLNDGQSQIEGFAPIIIGFVLVMVLVGAFIKLVRRAG